VEVEEPSERYRWRSQQIALLLQPFAWFVMASVEFLQSLVSRRLYSSAGVPVERGVEVAVILADAVCLSYFNYDLAMRSDSKNSSLEYSQNLAFSILYPQPY
jgi:hypothetical protein